MTSFFLLMGTALGHRMHTLFPTPESKTAGMDFWETMLKGYSMNDLKKALRLTVSQLKSTDYFDLSYFLDRCKAIKKEIKKENQICQRAHCEKEVLVFGLCAHHYDEEYERQFERPYH